MANADHLHMLNQGRRAWTQWREENMGLRPDLSRAWLVHAELSGLDLIGVDLFEARLNGANLSRAELIGANLFGADLREANLSQARLGGAELIRADLSRANLREADLCWARLVRTQLSQACLRGADLHAADLSDACLREADLCWSNLSHANLSRANLSNADLSWADLSRANLSETVLDRMVSVGINLSGAAMESCHIHGISVWGAQLEETIQSGLVITRESEPTVTVDNLEIAQFVYSLLYSRTLQQVLERVTAKIVLVLGRFMPRRKAFLHAIRASLLKRGYTGVGLYFDRPIQRDSWTTLSSLARLARFCIVELTDAGDMSEQLMWAIESMPSLPVQPLLESDWELPTVFDRIRHCPWVLAPQRYKDLNDLVVSFEKDVIGPAEASAKKLENRPVIHH